MSSKYLDPVELILRIRGEGVQSFVMNGEIVAIDIERSNQVLKFG